MTEGPVPVKRLFKIEYSAVRNTQTHTLTYTFRTGPKARAGRRAAPVKAKGRAAGDPARDPAGGGGHILAGKRGRANNAWALSDKVGEARTCEFGSNLDAPVHIFTTMGWGR